MPGKVLYLTDPNSGGGCLYSSSLMKGFSDTGFGIEWAGGRRSLLHKIFGGQDIVDQKIHFLDDIRKPDDLMLYDYIIWNGGYYSLTGNTERLFELNEWIKETKVTDRVALVDFRDCSGRQWGPDEFKELNYNKFFKRETSVEEYPDIVPLDPMAYFPDWFNELEKDIPISCMFGGNSGNERVGFHRGPIAQMISTKFPNAPVNLGEKVDQDVYNDIINRSQISISCWGQGYSCYRDWEILSAGAVLAYKAMPNPHLDKYVDMESAIVYQNAEELEVKLKFLMANPSKLESMRLNSNDISRLYNTPWSRANKVIHEMKELA